MVSLGVEDQEEEDEEEEEEEEEEDEDIEVHASPELGSWTLETRVRDERYDEICDTSIPAVLAVFSSDMFVLFCMCQFFEVTFSAVFPRFFSPAIPRSQDAFPKQDIASGSAHSAGPGCSGVPVKRRHHLRVASFSKH